MKSESTGSGVIFTAQGHVITNHHVVGDGRRIVCTLASKEEVEADLVGTDALADVAVVKLHPRPPRTFLFARFGQSARLAVGQTVLAMGSPLALSQSVTLGIVSNTEMVMPEFSWPFNTMELDGENVGSMVRWIGHDAPIHPGNSGGPLVDLNGRIVGINEISMGLAGAIPSDLAREVARQLMLHGKVRRSWIGLEVQPLLRSSKVRRGVLVAGAMEGSPAAKAGFRPGDILVELAGKPVQVRFAEELPLFNQLVAALPVGRPVRAVVLRGGARKLLTVTTRERQRAKPREREFLAWGMTVSNLSEVQARELGRPNQRGILVCSTRPGGPADQAKPQLGPRDVIVEVAGKPVADVSAFAAITRQITRRNDQPVPTLVTFDREQERHLTVVKVGVQQLEDPGLEVSKAWLPIRSQVLTTDLAEALGVPERTGVRVTRVFAGSEAEKAGLKVGDLIVALDGEPIQASQPEDVEVLPAMIRQYRIGSQVELTVLRNKKELKLSVTLPASPKLPREMPRYRDTQFEFTVRDVTFNDRARQNWSTGDTGAYVEAVDPGGWAALGRLAVGDLIHAVNDQPVRDMASLRAVMQKVAAKKPKSVVFHVTRGIHQLFVEMQPTWSDAR